MVPWQPWILQARIVIFTESCTVLFIMKASQSFKSCLNSPEFYRDVCFRAALSLADHRKFWCRQCDSSLSWLCRGDLWQVVLSKRNALQWIYVSFKLYPLWNLVSSEGLYMWDISFYLHPTIWSQCGHYQSVLTVIYCDELEIAHSNASGLTVDLNDTITVECDPGFHLNYSWTNGTTYSLTCLHTREYTEIYNCTSEFCHSIPLGGGFKNSMDF